MAAPLVVAGVAARIASKKLAKKVAKQTIKKGTKSTKGQGISTGKAKSIAREAKTGTPSHKELKQNDSFVNQLAKSVKKSGSTQQPADYAPKSVATSVKKLTAVKKRGK